MDEMSDGGIGLDWRTGNAIKPPRPTVPRFRGVIRYSARPWFGNQKLRGGVELSNRKRRFFRRKCARTLEVVWKVSKRSSFSADLNEN